MRCTTTGKQFEYDYRLIGTFDDEGVFDDLNGDFIEHNSGQLVIDPSVGIVEPR